MDMLASGGKKVTVGEMVWVWTLNYLTLVAGNCLLVNISVDSGSFIL